MSYISRDEQLLLKIRKNIQKLKLLFIKIEPLSDMEIDEGIEGLAITQCVTNLFELSSRIVDENIAQRLSLLSSGRTARMRNISSHDYDAVDWSIAKNNCRNILRNITNELLDDCITKILQKKQDIKDYTHSAKHSKKR